MRKVVRVRMLITLQALHVFFGILWFGGAMYANFVVIPATNKIDAVHANAFAVSYGRIAERFMTPVSILTLLFGIILGFPLGAWEDIGHPYGSTYLVAFIVAFVVWLWGMLMIGRNVKKVDESRTGQP
ncbi:MAG: hypothetical protein IRZ10_12430 [Thermoflavifilum sp.]|nr:hypothetical protein [Thermoflavifilum sp.]MCL6515206.1 hypothetical protein [Alicyclobacillus sp.]